MPIRNEKRCKLRPPASRTVTLAGQLGDGSGQGRTRIFLRGGGNFSLYSGQKSTKNRPYVSSLSSCRIPQSTHIAKCLKKNRLNLRTAGGLSHLRTAGGWIPAPPPDNSKTKIDSDKR